MKTCPGACGHTIPRRLVVCGLCWKRLPIRYRNGISGHDRTRYKTWTDAALAAVSWLSHHPIAKRHKVNQ